jgi:hypothetical protein
MFNIRLSEHLYLNPSFYPLYQLGAKNYPVYSTENSSLDTFQDEYEITRELSYFSLPVMLRYKLTKLVYVGAGPQFSLMAKAEDTFYASVDDNSLTYKRVITDEMNRIDVGVAGGVFVRFHETKGVTLSLRYYQGFIGTEKNNDTKVLNQNFQITVGIPVGAVDKDTGDAIE